jgi:hypothetical protein
MEFPSIMQAIGRVTKRRLPLVKLSPVIRIKNEKFPTSIFNFLHLVGVGAQKVSYET